MKNKASIREGAAMNPLNRQLFFKGFRKQPEHSLTPEKAAAVREDAGKEDFASWLLTLKSQERDIISPERNSRHGSRER